MFIIIPDRVTNLDLLDMSLFFLSVFAVATTLYRSQGDVEFIKQTYSIQKGRIGSILTWPPKPPMIKNAFIRLLKRRPDQSFFSLQKMDGLGGWGGGAAIRPPTSVGVIGNLQQILLNGHILQIDMLASLITRADHPPPPQTVQPYSQ